MREGTLALRTIARIVLPAIAAAVATSSVAQDEQSFHLALPLDCKFGETCFIQQYFDHDPSTAAKDYRGGTMSYDGHNGVDLRVPTTAALQKGVSVLAAASGVVETIRDDMRDVNVLLIGPDSVAGSECGNGVLINHGGGWETQYCHLAEGSVIVKPGQRVETGTPLGLVGLSGRTEFPHLHFSVGCKGFVVDPFEPDAAGACKPAPSLWSGEAAKALAYTSPAVINFGFTTEPVSMDDIETGRAGTKLPKADSPALIAYVRAIGLNAADVQAFTLKGPDGHVLAHSESAPLERNMAERFMYVGKRKSTGQWPRGTYEAEFEIRRKGATALSRRFSFDLK